MRHLEGMRRALYGRSHGCELSTVRTRAAREFGVHDHAQQIAVQLADEAVDLGLEGALCAKARELGQRERLGKDAAYRLDSGKLRNELGWSDAVSLESGIAETAAWVDRHLDALRDWERREAVTEVAEPAALAAAGRAARSYERAKSH